MSTISAGTTLTTALVQTGDTTGELVINTGASNTTAITVDASQNVGIGTSSPLARLSVTETSTTAGASDIVRVATASGGAFNIQCSDLSVNAPSWTIQTGNAEPLIFNQSTTERMRLDASGNLGLGTSSPVLPLQIYRDGSNATLHLTTATSGATGTDGFSVVLETGTNDAYIIQRENANMIFRTNNTTRMQITAAGLLQFNSGYGSVATAYGCRAWVNFNGTTGSVAIRASGNVTSITDSGTGNYTVNFTTAMPDINYTAVVTSGASTSRNNGIVGSATTSFNVRLFTADGTTVSNSNCVSVAIIR